MLNSKADMLRACWITRTGVGNELLEDETLAIVIYEDETSCAVLQGQDAESVLDNEDGRRERALRGRDIGGRDLQGRDIDVGVLIKNLLV